MKTKIQIKIRELEINIECDGDDISISHTPHISHTPGNMEENILPNDIYVDNILPDKTEEITQENQAGIRFDASAESIRTGRHLQTLHTWINKYLRKGLIRKNIYNHRIYMEYIRYYTPLDSLTLDQQRYFDDIFAIYITPKYVDISNQNINISSNILTKKVDMPNKILADLVDGKPVNIDTSPENEHGEMQDLEGELKSKIENQRSIYKDLTREVIKDPNMSSIPSNLEEKIITKLDPIASNNTSLYKEETAMPLPISEIMASENILESDKKPKRNKKPKPEKPEHPRQRDISDLFMAKYAECFRGEKYVFTKLDGIRLAEHIGRVGCDMEYWTSHIDEAFRRYRMDEWPFKGTPPQMTTVCHHWNLLKPDGLKVVNPPRKLASHSCMADAIAFKKRQEEGLRKMVEHREAEIAAGRNPFDEPITIGEVKA